MINLAESLRLYLVADPAFARLDFMATVAAALRGGVTMVQLRAKGQTDRELLTYAHELRELCSRFEALFIVNDRVDIALASKADGVHLGVDDLPVEAARSLAHPDFIVGYSPETDEDLRTAQSRGVDYLGIGPVYGTRTKSDAGDALGIEELRRRMELGKLPAVGIGGITTENSAEIMNAGAAGIAVISAILGADDAELAARQLSRNS